MDGLSSMPSFVPALETGWFVETGAEVAPPSCEGGKGGTVLRFSDKKRDVGGDRLSFSWRDSPVVDETALEATTVVPFVFSVNWFCFRSARRLRRLIRFLSSSPLLFSASFEEKEGRVRPCVKLPTAPAACVSGAGVVALPLFSCAVGEL